MVITAPLEIADKEGKGIGRYRVVRYSDEFKYYAEQPLCNCDNGHESKQEAIACPEAQKNL